MSESAGEDLIRITHYINPHMFWFKYETSFFGKNKLFDLENKLQQYFCENKVLSNKKYEPQIDEMVGVFNFSWNRWIRAKVDYIVEGISTPPKYILWAIDYGVPLGTYIRWIRELPEEFARQQNGSVFFGGLSNIVPAENNFDFMELCAKVDECDNWSPKAVKMIEELISDAASIKFIKDTKEMDGQVFGNLEITTHTNKVIKADIVLLETNQAKTTSNFLKVLKDLRTNRIPRWQTNEGNTLVFKYYSNNINTTNINLNTRTEKSGSVDTIPGEFEMEVKQKVTDWEERNELCQQNEVSIDDISFNDSASALNHQPSKKASKSVDINEDPSALLVAGTSRIKRLEKYKKHVPKPPKTSDPLPSLIKQMELANGDMASQKDGSSSLSESVSQSNNKSKENSSKSESQEKEVCVSDVKCEENSETKSISSAVSRAANARVAKLMNKRKSLQAKATPSEVLSNLSKMPDNVIPAGYDLRNLQPVKKVDSLSEESVPVNRPIDKSAMTSGDALKKHKQDRKPIGEFEEACLNYIYRIQSYAWPHLMRGNSLVVVSSARTGKTMSYLPAICSFIKMKIEEGRITEGVGPVAIIVVSSSVEAEKIARICRRFFLSNSSKVSVVEVFGIRNKEKAMRYLLNGCEILVSTVPALARLLSETVKLFEPKRIQNLIIDNVDMIHEELRSDLHVILRQFCSLSKRTNKTSVQLVVTSRTWNPFLYGFLKICNNPQLCIGAYIEAAVYGKSTFKMKLMGKDDKIREVFAFLDQHSYTTERTMIICNKDEEVDKVSAALRDVSIFEISVNDRSTAEQIELVSKWHRQPSGEMPILVCTDAILPELKIINTQNLIHYSLPSSWSKFAYRFSAVLGYYEDLLKTQDELKKDPPSSLILLDENNNSQLPKLIEFLQKHNCGTIPKEIINLSNKIRIQREEDNFNNKEFCPYLMEFGKCWNRNDCKYRHMLTKFDTPSPNIPTEGTIKVKIMSIISPTHYCVRLLEHASSKKMDFWRKINSSDDYVKFSLEFSEYYSNLDNHQSHWPINPGDICTAIDGTIFYRCKILQVTMRSNSIPGTLRVKLVDDGRIIALKSSNVLVLPDKFKSFPFQAFHLRLTDVVPFDYESEWDTCATQTVRQWIDKYVSKTVHVRAHIKLVLMDTIWVDKLVLLDHLKSISSHVYTINMKKILVEKNFAAPSSEAIEIITQMADKCGLLNVPAISAENIENGNISHDRENKNVYIKSDDSCKNTKISSSTDSNTCSEDRHMDELTKSLLNNKNASSIRNTPRITKKARTVKPFTKNIHSSIINEKWETLPENEFTRVIVGAFYSPNSFYVQQVQNVQRLEELYQEIDNFVSKQKIVLSETKLGQNCLAQYEGNYNRAKVSQVLCDAQDGQIKATIFFCDIGLQETKPLKHLLQTSDRIVNFLPFQAIRCKMVGINSLTNGVWTEEISDRIYDDIIQGCEQLYVRPLITLEPKLEENLKYWRHEVILIDCSSEEDVNINEKIVEKGLAEYDEDTKHYLDLVINLPFNDYVSSEEEENWDHINYVRPTQPKNSQNALDYINFVDLDINFTQEEALQLLNLPSTAKLLPPVDEDKCDESCLVETEGTTEVSKPNGQLPPLQELLITNRNDRLEENLVITEPHSETSEKPNEPLMPQLVCRQKCPQVVWKQSESLICLQISAPDVEDYYLRVTDMTLIFSAIIQNEPHMIVLNLLCAIEPRWTSHEIKGLTVVVRLVKAIKGIKWPRLTWEDEKLNWLKYNFEAIIEDDKDVLDTDSLTIHDTNIKLSSSDESDNDGDYDEMLDLINADKLYDPLEDDFN